MTELYCGKPVAGGRFVFSAEEAQHIRRVMRHRRGDRVLATDLAGNEYDVELETVTARAVEGRVLGSRTGGREPTRRLTLALAVLKGDHFYQACGQATELGISEFLPVVTERTLGRYGPGRAERLRRVALAAVKSSMRSRLPEIPDQAVTLDELIQRICRYGQALFAWEECTGPGLAARLDREVRSLLILVGPEGGFTVPEAERLERAGFGPFSLGSRRLRAETAAAAVVAVGLELLGELGPE